jgi:CO/xanthine dehydrogenase Mo-binding subunit
VLAYRADDAERRAAGLVLEVKGDFCHKVREVSVTDGKIKVHRMVCAVDCGQYVTTSSFRRTIKMYANENRIEKAM